MSKYAVLAKQFTDIIANNLFPNPEQGVTKSGKPFTEKQLEDLTPLATTLFQKLGLDFKETLVESMFGVLTSKGGLTLNDNFAGLLGDEDLEFGFEQPTCGSCQI